MVKNDKHQTRALMNDKREELEISQTLLNTITMFQDAVHDTAIGYHKKLRNICGVMCSGTSAPIA